MHRTLILAATAAVALGVAAPSANAAFPGQNGPILFGQGFEDGSGIFTTSPTSAPSLLFDTTGPGTPDNVDTTADGTRIAYNESDFSIWTANADGSARTRLTPDGVEDFGPAWSPDGTRIAFASRAADESSYDFTLWTMNADGTDRRQLGDVEDPIYGFQPAWSPDGTTIAFTEYGAYVRRSRGYHAIATTDPEGAGGIEYVVEGNDPEWTPDGRSIVYVDSYFSYGELYRYDVATGESVRLSEHEDGLRYTRPSVSPDGTRLVAEVETWETLPVLDADVDYDLAVLNTDGTGGTTILPGTRGAAGAEWSSAQVKPAPVPTVTPPAAAQQPAPAAQQQSSVTAAEPSKARVCGSRRSFNITVVTKGLKKVRVTVNGKTVTAARKGRGFSAKVDLRRLPKGRFTVKIRKTLAGGRVRTETRRYRTCVPKTRAR